MKKFLIYGLLILLSLPSLGNSNCTELLKLRQGPLDRFQLGELNFMLYSYSPAELNPFDIAEINKIWRESSAKIAHQAFEDERKELELEPNKSIGETFILIEDHQGMARPVGITANKLVETIPDIPSRAGSAKSCEAIGFVKTNRVEPNDWSRWPWREYELDLSQVKP